MKRIRRVFRWCVWTSLVLVCAALWYGHRQWQARNALIRQAVLDYARKQWPQLRISVDDCRMDLLHGVRLLDVRADFVADGRPLVRIPQIVVDVDSMHYLRTRQVRIDHVRIERPQLFLQRDRDGHWSIEPLLQAPPAGVTVPQLEVVGGTVAVHLLRDSGAVLLSARIERLTLSAPPALDSGTRPPQRCEFRGEIPPLGPLSLVAERWPDTGRIALSGTFSRFRTDRQLLRFAAELSPEFARLVAAWRAEVERRLSQPQDEANPFPLRLFLPAADRHASWVDALGRRAAIRRAAPPDFSMAQTGPASWSAASDWPRGAPNAQAVPSGQAAVVKAERTEGFPATEHALIQLGFEPSGAPEASRAHARPLAGDPPVSAAGGHIAAVTGLDAADDAARIEPEELWNFAVLDLDLVGELSFSLARWKPAGPWDYRLAYRLDHGRLFSGLLPYELEGFDGVVFVDAQSIRVEALSCRHGPTRFVLEAHVALSGAPSSNRVALSIRDLSLDERVKRHLSPGLTRLADLYQPSGPCDVVLEMRPGADGRWHPSAFRLVAKGCRVLYRDCPYPVHDLRGSIELDGDVFRIAMEGRAGQRPVTIVGLLKKAPPPAPFMLDVRAERLPIDDAARRAVPEAVRRVAEMLELRGELDVYLRVTRGADASPARMEIAAAVNDGVIEYEGFPYRIDGLTGQILYRSGVWTFQNLAGRHGAAELTGDAVFLPRTPTRAAELTLHVQAKAVALDESLHMALSPGLQSLWNDLQLQGRVNVDTDLHWVDGHPVELELPRIEWYDGSMTARWLPYAIDGIVGRFQYRDGRLAIEKLLGRHEETTFETSGYATIEPGLWTLRLESFRTSRLRADRELLRALERGDLSGLHATLSCLSPQTPIMLQGMVELKGTGREDDPVTAAWDLDAFLDGATIDGGLEYTGVDGRITSRGIYDGQQATAVGRLDLQRLTVLGYRLEGVSGPYHVAGNELILGSTQAFVPNEDGQEKPIDVKQRITAEFIGGVIALDARSTLDPEPDYEIHLDLSYGRLEEYARLYMKGARNLKGVMNGWADLKGHGSSLRTLRGRGQLQISPAALYELPVIMQVFRVLSLNLPERSAFNYALFDFYVQDGAVRFNSIDLVGNSVSLHSRGGVVYLDGRIDLEFYSMLPRGQVPIPALDVLLKQTTTGWVGVEVKGTLENPRASIKPAPLLDDALKRFLNAFEVRPPQYPVRPRRRGYSLDPRTWPRR